MSQLLHLYWRAGFGLSPAEWQSRSDWSVDQGVNDLFERANAPRALPAAASPDYTDMMVSAASANEKRQEERRLMAGVSYDWLLRMANPAESALLERMCLFWHGHFACEIKFSQLATGQLNTLRTHALGNFRDLVLAIARDPAMIRYLNNQQNRKNAPNENFARELMELFTIGRGNYTEQDVKEGARAFTGWSSDRKGAFVFRRLLHDYGEKTFMGKNGNFDGTDIIDMLLARKETARFICWKVYRYFVNEQVDQARVEQLAEGFFASGYDISKLMQTIFRSDWFYAPENVGNRIKSPVELMAGMMRQLRVSNISTEGLLGLQRALGQILFKPPNVAGWPGGRYWIDNSTLLLRLQLAAGLFKAAEFDFQLSPELEQDAKMRLRKLEAELDFGPLRALAENSAEPLAALAELLLQVPPPAAAIRQSPGGGTDASLLALQLMTLPEYQLC